MKRLNVSEQATVIAALQSLGFRRLADEMQDRDLWHTSDAESLLLVNATDDVTSDQFNVAIFKDFDVDTLETVFDRDANAALRGALITIRNNFHANHYYREEVVITHAIAWLVKMQAALTLEPASLVPLEGEAFRANVRKLFGLIKCPGCEGRADKDCKICEGRGNV